MSQKLFVAAGIFHPESGGPATYLYEILPHLQRLNWDIRLLTYGNEVTNHNYGYPVERIPRRFLPLRLWNYQRAAQPLSKWADLVYSHTIDLPLSQKGSASHIIKIVGDQAWERCIRRSWIPATTDIDMFQKSGYSPIVSWQQNSRAKQVREVDAVIVPSNYLKQMVIGWGVPADKIHVIYNALPEIDLTTLPPKEVLRKSLDLDDRPTILTAARLNPWKGIDHLITAVSRLPDVRLLIAGDGPEKAHLESLAANLGNHVVFLGRIPREKLYQYMRAVDYFALYSGYEGLPHTILESLRVGTPVIASDKGGNPEVVQHGTNGWLVPYVDVDALTDIIQMAVESTNQQRLTPSAGLEKFTFGRMVQRTDEVLRSYV